MKILLPLLKIKEKLSPLVFKPKP